MILLGATAAQITIPILIVFIVMLIIFAFKI